MTQAAITTLCGSGASAALSQQTQDFHDLATYDFLIARVRFHAPDGWSMVASAENNLLKAIQEILRCKVKILRGMPTYHAYTHEKHLNAVVTFDDLERICLFPFLLMTSNSHFQFTAQQKRHFKAYVERGGFVIMDDCVFGESGDFFFQSGFTLLKELFGATFCRIPKTHEIFHNIYDMADSGLPFTQGQRRGAWGVFVGDRLAVLLSPGDMHCGWADSQFFWFGPHGKPGCQGYHECIRMGVNLAAYAMSH